MHQLAFYHALVEAWRENVSCSRYMFGIALTVKVIFTVLQALAHIFHTYFTVERGQQK